MYKDLKNAMFIFFIAWLGIASYILVQADYSSSAYKSDMLNIFYFFCLCPIVAFISIIFSYINSLSVLKPVRIVLFFVAVSCTIFSVFLFFGYIEEGFVSKKSISLSGYGGFIISFLLTVIVPWRKQDKRLFKGM
ncbi:MAG: hypothetical protein HWE24_20295 [Oceanospirillaceae bacterium]|nr:hypothetical protein [Oceanospirillaceae bacterium]